MIARTKQGEQETCRLRAVSTSHVLVEAVTSFCTEQQPKLTWLHERYNPSRFDPVIAHVTPLPENLLDAALTTTAETTVNQFEQKCV